MAANTKKSTTSPTPVKSTGGGLRSLLARSAEAGYGGSLVDRAAAVTKQLEQPSEGASRMRVPLSQLEVHPLNARRVRSTNSVTSIAASLGKDGQLEALVVVPRRDGVPGYWVLGGGTRLAAMQLLQWKDAEVRIREPDEGIDPKELAITDYLVSYTLNASHTPQTVFDNAQLWRTLIDEHGLKQNELSTMLGLLPAKVSRTLSILDLPKSVLAFVEEHAQSFSERSAYGLSRLATKVTEERLLSVANDYVAEKVSIAQLETMVASPSTGTQTRRRPTTNLRFVNEGSKAALKHFPDGRLQLTISGGRAANLDLDAIKDKIRSVLLHDGFSEEMAGEADSK